MFPGANDAFAAFAVRALRATLHVLQRAEPCAGTLEDICTCLDCHQNPEPYIRNPFSSSDLTQPMTNPDALRATNPAAIRPNLTRKKYQTKTPENLQNPYSSIPQNPLILTPPWEKKPQLTPRSSPGRYLGALGVRPTPTISQSRATTWYPQVFRA